MADNVIIEDYKASHIYKGDDVVLCARQPHQGLQISSIGVFFSETTGMIIREDIIRTGGCADLVDCADETSRERQIYVTSWCGCTVSLVLVYRSNFGGQGIKSDHVHGDLAMIVARKDDRDAEFSCNKNPVSLLHSSIEYV